WQARADGLGSRSAHLPSPKLSLVFGPWQQTEAFVNWGTGFHSNDARGALAATDPAPPLVKSRGAELGLRSEIVPGLQSSRVRAAPLRPARPGGRRLAALACDDAGLAARRLAREPRCDADGGCLQPLRQPRQRHRLRLHVAPARRAFRRRDGPPFPPRRAAQ